MAIITDGTAKWELMKVATTNDINDGVSNKLTLNSPIRVPGSTQITMSPEGYSPRHQGSSYSFSVTGTKTGIAAGSFSLQSLLQDLVIKSHTHSPVTKSYNCDCYTGDGG